MSSIGFDIRYAIRALLRQRLFATVIVVTLALGVGANAAIFDFAYGLLFRPIPGLADARRVVTIRIRSAESEVPLAYEELGQLRRRIPSLHHVASHFGSADVGVSGADAAPAMTSADFVTGDFFAVLGLRASSGSFFDANADVQAIGSPAAVVSYRLAGRLFGGQSPVGRTIQVNGVTVTVTGVGPRDFRGIDRSEPVDLWLPAPVFPRVLGLSFNAKDVLEGRSIRPFADILALTDNTASLAAIRAQTTALIETLKAQNRDDKLLQDGRVTVQPGIVAPIETQTLLRRMVGALAAVALAVLIISIANASNLMLFRALRERRTTALRRALGASTGRLTRLHLIQSILIGLASAAVGLFVAVLLEWGASRLPLPIGAGVMESNSTLLAFAVAMSVLVSIVATAAPAIFSERVGLTHLLRAGDDRISGRSARTLSLLAAVQLTASIPLLACSILGMSALHRLRSVHLGFDADAVTAASIDPVRTGYSFDQANILFRDVLRRLSQAPGVEAAALTAQTPFAGRTIRGEIWRDAGGGRRDPNDRGIEFVSAVASPAYFRAMGIPVVEGRSFSDGEFLQEPGTGEDIVVVSRALAVRLTGAERATDKYVILPGRTKTGVPTDHAYRIVGVVADSHWGGLDAPESAPMMYFPFSSRANRLGSVTLLLRSSLRSNAVSDIVRRTVRDASPQLPVFGIETLRAEFESSIAEPRLVAAGAAVLTAIALLLAGIGFYALMAFSVSQRMQEFGIRIALGATARDIVRLAFQRSVRAIVAGAFAGVVAALLLARFLEHRVLGVQWTNPAAYATAVLGMIAVGLLASAIPVWQAVRVDPTDAIRNAT